MDQATTPDVRERFGPALLAVAAIAAVAAQGVSAAGAAGAAGSVGLALSAMHTRQARVILHGEVVPMAIALALLAGTAGGTAAPGGGWRLVLVIVAYPFLGRTLLRLVRRHRQVREADVLVEAALVATAVGIVLHVATAAASGSLWGEVGAGFATVLVALDVGLLVVGGRTLVIEEARRGPLGALNLGIAFLLVAHLAQQLHLTNPHLPESPVGITAALGLVAVGGAALLPGARREPTHLIREIAPFSATHAVVVGSALLAAPIAFSIQAGQGVTPSATVATGALLSGLILAGYLVQLLRERAAIEHHATHDGLTLLPNRTLLVDRLERSIAHARRNGRFVGTLFVDLDRFKEVNDTFGHAAGDALLQQVAQRLQACVRDEDTVARLAGDEFVVLLPHLLDADEVVVVAERMLAALGDPFTIEGDRLLVSGSVGIAVYPHDGATADEILACADAAMYSAKETNGSHWHVYSPRMASEALSRMQLEAELLDAIARGELVLHYQPIVDARSGAISGAEALVRWEHAERGMVPPADFIPLAERSDLIVLVGDYVLRSACEELRRWQDQGLRNKSISVNVAARHFTSGLVETVTAALRETGADPFNLIVELTESTVVDNLDAVVDVLEELASLGVRAAIDDFGTGYCGLRYLSVLPVASLKIDRSFIQGMTPSDAAIVGATIAMGHSLGLRITAEGVETVDQQRFLIDQGADHLQGYWLGRPMPADQLVERMAAERDAMPSLAADWTAPRALAAS